MGIIVEDRVVEDAKFSDCIQVERKSFFFDLKENDRGPFLRITEEVGGRRDAIVVPATGLVDFRAALDRAIMAQGRSGGDECGG